MMSGEVGMEMDDLNKKEDSNKQEMAPKTSPRPGRFQVNIVSEKPEASPKENKDKTSPVHSEPSSGGHSSPLGNEDFDHSMAMQTFGQNTIEVMPSLDYYRNLFSTSASAKQRPTLNDLHEPIKTPTPQEAPADAERQPQTSSAAKFGWIKGVLIRCVLNIWGVMLFLRLTWIVGQAGILYASVIILMSAVVTTLTTLSMSAICTNGEVKGGGAYYMISRSLGPEFGGSIGLIFSVANTIAVAMYVVGFSETVALLLKEYDAQMVSLVNDVRIIGMITIVILLAILFIGMAWEAKVQLVLLVVLSIAIFNMVVGSFLPVTDAKAAKGFTGYKKDVFVENLKPSFQDGESFFSVFSIFFPAATGILAGANISGDLQDAQKAIPKGTLLAILISTIIYVGLSWIIGGCMIREATGSIADVIAGNVTSACLNGTMNCEYGLVNDLAAAKVISGWVPLVLAGIFAASLSSALASLVSAPKVFQAVCKDKIFPKIEYFAYGVGAGDEPKRAYVLTFFIAAAFIAIGDLNTIAPLISNFFLASYALINFSCFSASLAKSPGWRPAFKYYNMWVALLASVICVGVMFLINWWAALLTIAIISGLYLYVHSTKPEVNWGDSNQAFLYKRALQTTIKLGNVPEHVKTFRPQILLLTGPPNCRPAMLHLCSHITKNTSLLLCGNVILGEQPEVFRQLRTAEYEQWLNYKKIKAFLAFTTAPNLRKGAQQLMQLGGLGKIRPNTMFMGFKRNWSACKPQDLLDYVGIIHDAFDLQLGVCILRLREGSDVSAALDFEKEEANTQKEDIPQEDEKATNSVTTPTITITQDNTVKENQDQAEADEEEEEEKEKENAKESTALVENSENDVNHQSRPLLTSEKLVRNMPIGSVIKTTQKFQGKQPKGTIDVWWLFDDGGLTLLIPHLLTQKTNWQKCKLRVFASGKKERVDDEKRNMANMLSKFRIPHDSVNIIPNIGKKPSTASVEKFNEIIQPWLLKDGEDPKMYPWKISEEDVESLKEKTMRQIRLRELLQEHSKDANLIVMSLPMPRKNLCPPIMYMCWLEVLSGDLPPIMLMRGNQTSVLTYYS
ncbi:solute carrier family 12 member 3-like [Lytechinus variegatus]|uniref:solute carrier family 12 member 3-like n=1 Tax=Lytechinus variegatus TaxID=7654 RepID=UPI001BB0F7C2|nr:solute carrier family 12 member 3-like [Lytechinus variegatus]